jgi:hypothetical protein
VPHDQSPGRLLAYSRLWAPLANQAIRSQLNTAFEALRQNVQKAGFLKRAEPQPIESLSCSSLPRSCASIPDCIRGLASRSPVRVYLDLDLVDVAARFEQHVLERHLAITYPVHQRIAAAQEALDEAMNEYGKMLETAVARAALRKDKTATKGARSPADVRQTLGSYLCTQDRCDQLLFERPNSCEYYTPLSCCLKGEGCNSDFLHSASS